MSENTFEYRRDVDGLRGLAVTAVVLFHAHVFPFTGGYVGVDVFFVISGYLITSIILGDFGEGQFTFTKFYGRRARRILPALMLMLVVVTIPCMVLLLPDELVKYGQNLIESVFFSLNIFLWRDMGYFDLTANQRPLLHLWSLAVEEQFYVLWPLLLWVMHRLKARAYIGVAVIAILVASLALSQWTTVHAPGAAFYLSPSRAWELMLGAALSLPAAMPLRSRLLAETAAACGLALIGYAIFAFDSATQFPGLNALFPCVGTALIIQAGKDQRTVVSSLFASRPFVAVGLISYSLYLWHWPLFSLAHLYFDRDLLWTETTAIIALSVIMATLSWWFVEQPIRRSFKRPQTSLMVGAASMAVVSLGALLLIHSGGLPGRLPPEALRSIDRSQRATALEAHCQAPEGYGLSPVQGCLFGTHRADDNYNAILWGDSHANALQPALEQIARRNGLTFREMVKSACPPLLDVKYAMQSTFNEVPNILEGCMAYNAAVLEAIEHTPGLKLVVLTARWSAYLRGPFGAKGAPLIASVNGAAVDYDGIFSAAVERTVDLIIRRRIHVVLIGQTPEFSFNPARCIARGMLVRGADASCSSAPVSDISLPFVRTDSQIATIASKNPLVKAYFPTPMLCERTICPLSRGGLLLYHDTNHVSIDGAMYLATSMAAVLQ